MKEPINHLTHQILPTHLTYNQLSCGFCLGPRYSQHVNPKHVIVIKLSRS